jgi:hypothetical protein
VACCRHVFLRVLSVYFLKQHVDSHICTKKTPWSESASELYRPSDRRLSAKWLPTFADRGCHVVSVDGSLRPYSRFSRQEPLLFYQVAPQLYSRGWVDPVPDLLLFFLVVPGIEPGPPDLWPRSLTTRPQRRSHICTKEQILAGCRRLRHRDPLFVTLAVCSVLLGQSQRELVGWVRQ